MMTETLPGLLAERARRTPTGVALRRKQRGIWCEITWQDYLEGARAVAGTMAALGLRPGDTVALIGGQHPLWLQAELGIQAAGGVALPLSPDVAAAELADMLQVAEARFAVVEGQEQVDVLLALRDRLPSLEQVLYWDPRGMRAYADPWLRPLAGDLSPRPALTSGSFRGLWGPPARRSDPMEGPNSRRGETVSPSPNVGSGGRGVRADRGEEPGEGASPDFDAMLAALTPDTVAEIVFTPGTGGAPRGVRLTHANLIAAARAMAEGQGLDANGEFVSFAPNAWIGDRAFATAAALVAGYTVNLPESPETVLQDIQEIGPRLMVAPPAVWQRLATIAWERAEGSGRLRRRLYHGTLGTAGSPRRGPLSEVFIRRPVRDHLGLLRVQRAYVAGAPLPDETLAFFRALGVPLAQLYVVTAAGGPVAVGEDGGFRALPGVELQVGPDGEVLVRGPGVAPAYQADTEPVAAVDGWLRTGDLGRIEPNGALTLLDRVDHAARLAHGVPVVPAEIERRLAASPYIRHAVAVAAGRPFVAALIGIDGRAVGAWAERRGLALTTYADLARHPDVHELVRDAVQQTNTGLPESLRVQRFAILDRELSADEGDLTWLGTVRRPVMLDRWSEVVDALYGSAPATETGPRVVTVEREATAVS
jgi:long-chain acyl-CoA synthetase